MTGSPPTFDDLFDQQQRGGPSRQMSSGSDGFGSGAAGASSAGGLEQHNGQNAFGTLAGGYVAGGGPSNRISGADVPLTDEPPSLHRRGSNGSIRSLRHGKDPSGAAGNGGYGGSDGRPHRTDSASSAMRQDSIPIPFASTLLSTDPKAQGQDRLQLQQQQQQHRPHPLSQGFNGGNGGNGMSYDPQGYASGSGSASTPYHEMQSSFRQQQADWGNPVPTDMLAHEAGPSYITGGGDSLSGSAQATPASAAFTFDGPSTATTSSEPYRAFNSESPFAPETNMAGVAQAIRWETDFLSQANPVGYGNGGNAQTGTEWLVTGGEEQDFNAELERILSLPASANPSPQSFDQPNYLQQQQNQAFLSNAPTPSAQNHSPYQAQAGFPRSGSSKSGSPFGHKPQSPPSLVIPNHPSPTPALPPIITAQPDNPPASSGSTGVNLAGQTAMGGLLPPANPALDHLSGMAGISPIGPNADGPMIFVQPSTPISGLKDGRGMFDAALKRAAQVNQANQQWQGQRGSQAVANSTGFDGPSGQRHDRQGSMQDHTGFSRMFGEQQQQQQQQQQSQQQQQQSQQQQQQQQQQSGSQIQHSPQPNQFACPPTPYPAFNWNGYSMQDTLRTEGLPRPRAKSDSYSSGANAGLDRAAMLQFMASTQAQNMYVEPSASSSAEDPSATPDWRNNVDVWRNALLSQQPTQAALPSATMDPRHLPGSHSLSNSPDISLDQQRQLNQLQAQRSRMAPLNVDLQSGNMSGTGGVFKYEPGEFSPTSLAFYNQMGLSLPMASNPLGGTVSAPFFATSFQNIPQNAYPQTAGPAQQSFLMAGNMAGGSRRRSFAEGMPMQHHAAGAGTPGYGAALINPASGLTLDPGAGPIRGVSPSGGHRRAARSEDFGRTLGTGWGMGQGGSTADFLNSITAEDGSLLPPSRGRSHSRHSSASSVRSASPALSISSHGSSSPYIERMDMPDGVTVQELLGEQEAVAAGPAAKKQAKVAKMKVTSMATEVASTSRRTNEGVFKCPVPGCGSTFTRHFNLKGHLRSHADIRPYKCLYDGCPKATIGFARHHDCKRHMLLHEGLRPFECEGCGKKFARLDALTRHHKSEQGQECAISHPLPTNPDGSAMSESQYKSYRAAKENAKNASGSTLSVNAAAAGMSRRASFGSHSGTSGGEEDDLGTGSGMDDYDLA